MEYPIVDLHCDLLFYLAGHSKRTPYETVSRCSIPQLKQGNVKLQTLAVYTQTEFHSVQNGLSQIHIYQSLAKLFPNEIFHFSSESSLSSSGILTLFAFENASGFCGEGERFQEGIDRLNQIIRSISKPLYISMTWNSENRFGGGAESKVGLKEDGKRLLNELHGKKIAIDLSHASDALAYETIDYIEGQCLDISLIASHSNARIITSVPRNLPDDIAKEIFRRNGIVGLNLYHSFIGESEEFILKHLVHWLELGGEKNICFGADFFYEADLPSFFPGKVAFFKNYQDASCYHLLLKFIQKELKFSNELLEKLAYRNAWDFVQDSYSLRALATNFQ